MRDCECNAAKRCLRSLMPTRLPCRLAILGDDLYCHPPIREPVLDCGEDFLIFRKLSSRTKSYDELSKRRFWSTGWIRTRNSKK